MKLVFFGDSITDAGKREDYKDYSYGQGFLGFVAGELLYEKPFAYEIVNKGIAGHRIVDLYGRIQEDVWDQKPDFLNVLVGINDSRREFYHNEGVSIKEYEKIYRSIIEGTKERFPDIKIMLCAPFILEGAVKSEEYDEFFKMVKEYANLVETLAKEYGAYFFSFQRRLEEKAKENSPYCWLWDGVHPTRAGAKLLAEEWLKVFKNQILGEK